MEKKFCLTVNKETLDFCRLNGIEDIREFVVKCYKKGLAIERYGATPSLMSVEKEVVEKIIEKDKIIEVVKEVPVEKVVEKVVEVIKEIPIEKVILKEVIKEVPVERVVEKKVYVTDDNQISELGGKIANLEGEKEILRNKILEIEREKQQFSNKIMDLDVELQKFSTKEGKMEKNFQKELSEKEKTIKKITEENISLNETIKKYDDMFAQFEKKINVKKTNRDNLYDD